MNAVGIDASKGKSMAAVMRPCGEAALAPFEVSHTGGELSELAKTLKSLPGETRVVMEYTGYYHAPIALALREAGLYVSIVNPLLAHDYGNDSLRRARKTPSSWRTMPWTAGISCRSISRRETPAFF